jgi:hypothetical protein
MALREQWRWRPTGARSPLPVGQGAPDPADGLEPVSASLPPTAGQPADACPRSCRTPENGLRPTPSWGIVPWTPTRGAVLRRASEVQGSSLTIAGSCVLRRPRRRRCARAAKPIEIAQKRARSGRRPSHNAMCESFFATLECEADRSAPFFRSHSEARMAVFKVSLRPMPPRRAQLPSDSARRAARG